MARSPRRALTSLMIWAPASSAAAATSAFCVSMLMGTVVSAASSLMTGMTRRSSSSADTGSLPGRVLSPPTSMTSAPSAHMARPCSTASVRARKLPPSEKESGVTFRMPMTSGALVGAEGAAGGQRERCCGLSTQAASMDASPSGTWNGHGARSRANVKHRQA